VSLAGLLSALAAKDGLTTFYIQNLRASLFSGFLTLAGFLFTIKTFLIIRLNQDIYGDKEYQ
jgi:hypothetical protein